tara:strand:- start:282 stop:893 length:612 start_codon:yes stop_codon:yes gene_type:complete
MIGIVSYGYGNIQAFLNIFKLLNIKAKPVSNFREIEQVDKLILPGVGSFDTAIKAINDKDILPVLNSKVLVDKIPILGVCVGLQMMANSSEEGDLRGFGWIPGKVIKFKSTSFNTPTHTPHMGWNSVRYKQENKLFNGIDNPQFYFLHSYYIVTDDLDNIISVTNYGHDFASCIALDNIYATQFHPEKSHKWGIKLLQNFANL